MTHQGRRKLTEAREKYRDFSEMPDDALRALANDIANPKKALRRIRSIRRATITEAGRTALAGSRP